MRPRKTIEQEHQLFCTYLIHATGNPAMPGAWLTVPTLLALVSAFLTRPYTEAAPPKTAAGAPA